MTIPAKSVMTTDLVTVPPETTVAEAARRMLIHHVTAVPVVDPDNRPLGLVSEGDVMRHFGAQFQTKRAQWLRMLAEGEILAPEFLTEIRLNQQHVREIMHTAIISADEEASLAELADLILQHVDDIGIRPELSEMEDALLRDDGADQEGDQHDDGNRLPSDPVELIDQRGQPQRFRPAQHADHGHDSKCARPLVVPMVEGQVERLVRA